MSFVPAELLVRQDQSLQSDGEAHITARHHVLDLKVQEAGRKAQFLHHPSILPGRQPRVFFTGEAGEKGVSRGRSRASPAAQAD